jgi:hypothetical protein
MEEVGGLASPARATPGRSSDHGHETPNAHLDPSTHRMEVLRGAGVGHPFPARRFLGGRQGHGGDEGATRCRLRGQPRERASDRVALGCPRGGRATVAAPRRRARSRHARRPGRETARGRVPGGRRPLERGARPRGDRGHRCPRGDSAVTASLGVAVFPEDAPDAARLVRNADRALYRAKANGRNRVEMFTLDDGTEDESGLGTNAATPAAS